MIQQQPQNIEYDPAIQITDPMLAEKLGESALVGKWFVFLRADWLSRSGMDHLLAQAGIMSAAGAAPRPAILFRGKQELTLPGATIAPTPLPAAQLISLSSDKALYRAHHDTVRLLIVAPLRRGETLTMRLHLGSNLYGEYPPTLDEYGLYLWSLSGLPEGAYEAELAGIEDVICRFEVAEYRLAPLNAELLDQQLSGEVLRYTLSVSAFGQPYVGSLEVELQERDRRTGKREHLTCDRQGQCRGVATLTGAGPFTLNLFAGERTATVMLKGSEQSRRETLVISELGEIRSISLLPLAQSNTCRGIYVTRAGSNDQPFVMQRVIGSEAEITPRVEIERLKAIVVDPARGTSEEHVYSSLAAGQTIRLPIPSPYGVILLGAFLDGHAWEGWCAVLRPPVLQVQCEVSTQARPGERIAVHLKTNLPDRVVPVQVIVKDQRLIAASDPQVELAADIKRNLTSWHEQSATGPVAHQLASYRHYYRHGPFMMRAMASPVATPFPQQIIPTSAAMPTVQPLSAPPIAQSAQRERGGPPSALARSGAEDAARQDVAQERTGAAVQTEAVLANMRLAFPEVIYNAIVQVQGETTVEVKLGDALTRYSIEAFALAPGALDWQRVETSVEAVQPVYGELSVSPFVAPGDAVLGRLAVGATSGAALVEVRHDEKILPLFYENGEEVTPGLPVPSGSVLRFPVQPGVITSVVRDARKGGVDASERYVTAPGQLRHIARRVRLLLPGEQITLDQPPLLEIKPMPGLERPFQFFLEGAIYYPFGCIEQTSMKLLAMFTGYIVNLENAELAGTYAAAIPAWHKRLRSMALPGGGFCMYPPDEGHSREVDTHYAPRGVQHLLHLPAPARSGIRDQSLLAILADIHTLAQHGAAYYKLAIPPRRIESCHDAYLVMQFDESRRDEALAYARTRLRETNGQTCVAVPENNTSHHLYGTQVAQRQETAFAAATLLAGRVAADVPKAIAATNYLTGQLNEEGRLYSTVDTAACLSLLLGLRDAGIIATPGGGRVEINGQSMSLAEALAYSEKVKMVRCIEGVIAVQVTSEVVEAWDAFSSAMPVEVRLERGGRPQRRFRVGDALDLVISVPRYEPGLIAHVCLPDALARITGGGQVKRFSLDFCGQTTLRVPLAAISTTALPPVAPARAWFVEHGARNTGHDHEQHWAVIVRNMYKEEQVGNPGRLMVEIGE
jgi:hypothetical protein